MIKKGTNPRPGVLLRAIWLSVVGGAGGGQGDLSPWTASTSKPIAAVAAPFLCCWTWLLDFDVSNHFCSRMRVGLVESLALANCEPVVSDTDDVSLACIERWKKTFQGHTGVLQLVVAAKGCPKTIVFRHPS